MAETRLGLPSPDETLCIKDGVGGVLGRLVLGSLTDETFVVVGECDPRRSDTGSYI